jgi:hypothetical protein
MSVISGIYGAKKQKEAAGKAADSQVESTRISTQAMMDMYNQSREDTAGQREMFNKATPMWDKMFQSGNMGPNINLDLENDQIYQATRDETMKALNRRAAATGKYSSSDADNAITRNMSALLSDSYNRKLTENQIGYNRLLDATKIGAGAAASAGNNALATGQSVAGLNLQAGNAMAQNYLAQGQASANAANSVGQGATNAYMMWLLTRGQGGG